MSEGGFFAWKRQEIDSHRGPAGNYNSVSKSLPDPPKGTVWIQNNATREWTLEKKQGEEEIAVAEMVYPHDGQVLFFEHTVQSSDTFAGICLKYKVTPTELRQANGGFSGTNLFLAPNPLKIPKSIDHVIQATVHSTKELSPEQKIIRVLSACSRGGLSKTEAKCYLELNNWSLDTAIEEAHKDGF